MKLKKLKHLEFDEKKAYNVAVYTKENTYELR